MSCGVSLMWKGRQAVLPCLREIASKAASPALPKAVSEYGHGAAVHVDRADLPHDAVQLIRIAGPGVQHQRVVRAQRVDAGDRGDQGHAGLVDHGHGTQHAGRAAAGEQAEYPFLFDQSAGVLGCFFGRSSIVQADHLERSPGNAAALVHFIDRGLDALVQFDKGPGQWPGECCGLADPPAFGSGLQKAWKGQCGGCAAGAAKKGTPRGAREQ